MCGSPSTRNDGETARTGPPLLLLGPSLWQLHLLCSSHGVLLQSPRPPLKLPMKPQALGLLYSAVRLSPAPPGGQTVKPCLSGSPDFICRMGAREAEERGPPVLPSPSYALPWQEAGKGARAWDWWDGPGTGQMEEGRQHLWAQHPERQETGGGQGLYFGGTCFGSFTDLAPPRVSRAACQITTEGMWERAGRGEGSLDKLAHTRQMFAQKNTVKSSCKYNRESAFSHHWLVRLPAFLSFANPV